LQSVWFQPYFSEAIKAWSQPQRLFQIPD